VRQSSDDAPTGPIRGEAPIAATPPPRPPDIPGGGAGVPTRGRNVRRDLTAAGLLVVAALLPWNVYFGLGIPDSKTVLFGLLGAVTLLSLVAIAAPAGRVRVILNVPYWLLVLGFVVFDVFQTIRFGGTVKVPGGVGPGAWLGVAGSVLAVQSVITGPAADAGTSSRWLRCARIIGYASLVGATLSTAFNLFWGVRFALKDPSGTGFGKKNIVVLGTTTVYGLVALAAVLVASRWLLKSEKAAHLAAAALGASTLVAGPVVWLLPVGRDIDSFHGIAQNTSTAGVGFEGYLAWAVGAAIFAPRALSGYRRAGPDDESSWRTAARKGLALIILWCLGSVLMRLTDLASGVALNLPYSRYDSLTLAAFNVAIAVLAFWLRAKLANSSVSSRLITSLCGLLVTFSVARVVVGVMLAARFPAPPGGNPYSHPVYGNNLAQQITSTFDVALCGLALGILVAVRISTQLSGRRRRRRQRRAVHARRPVPAGTLPPSAAATTRIPARAPDPGMPPPTGVVPQLAGSGAGAPRIFRGDDSATRQIPLQPPAEGPVPKIFRPQDPG
jgi:hypothetical protein